MNAILHHRFKNNFLNKEIKMISMQNDSCKTKKPLYLKEAF